MGEKRDRPVRVKWGKKKGSIGKWGGKRDRPVRVKWEKEKGSPGKS